MLRWEHNVMKPERTVLLSLFLTATGIALASGFAIFFAPVRHAYAQAAAPVAPVFALSVSPQFPNAGEPVTISAIPENFAASSTVFTWYKNGSRLDAVSGLGRSAIIVPTNPEAAEVIQVRVVAAPGGNFSTAEQNALITTIPGPGELKQLTEGAASEFSLQATNPNPDPGETVTIEVITFAFDKDRASYEWRVNGVRQREASGRGQYRLALPPGKEGEARTVSVTLTTPDGITRTKNVAVRAVSAPLYWWADTGVPYWYKGKALPVAGTSVNVIALPAVANPGGLAYQWRFNGGLVPQASGLGKSRYSFTLQFPVREQIEVAMQDAAGTFSKTAAASVKPAEPQVGIYPLVPKRGVAWERRAAEFSADSGQPHQFIAVPFFFPRAGERALAYIWNLNGKDIAGEPPDPWRFILTSNPGTPAQDRLGVDVRGRSQPVQRTGASITIQLR